MSNREIGSPVNKENKDKDMAEEHAFDDMKTENKNATKRKNDSSKSKLMKTKKSKNQSTLWTKSTAVIHPTHMYLRISVEQYKHVPERLPRFVPLKYDLIAPAIVEALRRMYGNFGSSRLLYEFVNSKSVDGHVILCVPVEHHKRLWAAITCFSNFDGLMVRFTVTHATPFLFALENN